jgi:SAM-dependent methyltransferase
VASLLHMSSRPCPFCFSESSSIFGVRGGVWVRCRNCRSVFQDITVGQFAQLHDEAWQDTRFAESVVAARGLEPASGRWDELSLSGTSLLEFGPGTGHLLAAAQKAGCSVAGVETSGIHREFIRNTWGIRSLYPDVAALPSGVSFDAIVAINVLEHVYDISEFLRSIARLLTQNGVLFLATPNAVSLEAAVLRNWWSMCKEHDHVSFPSPEGIAQAAQAIDLRPERIWSSELPFEFPISALVSARDWTRARRAPSSAAASNGQSAEIPPAALDAAAKARLARFYSISGRFDPTSRLLGILGRAGNLKARLRPGECISSSS